MNKPTVGDIVWFYTNREEERPLVAIIAHVHSDECVNLAIFNQSGRPLALPPTSVLFVRDSDDAPSDVNFCCPIPHHGEHPGPGKKHKK